MSQALGHIQSCDEVRWLNHNTVGARKVHSRGSRADIGQLPFEV